MHGQANPSPHPEPPCLDAVLAGTVALMTVWARLEGGRDEDSAHRMLLSRQIVSNLFVLVHHPQAHPGLRQSMGAMHEQWIGLAQAHDLFAERGPTALRQALH